MNWNEPADDFAHKLAAAREAVLAHPTDHWKVIEPFEPILEHVRYIAKDPEAKLARIRSLGRLVFAELQAVAGPVAMEVRHYVWHIQHLGDPTEEFPTSSMTDMLMQTLTRMSHYANHNGRRCSICTQFPHDLPYQARPGGPEHFNGWLKKGLPSRNLRNSPDLA